MCVSDSVYSRHKIFYDVLLFLSKWMFSMSQSVTRISVFALVMLITVSIDSIRNLPIAALFGPQMIFFFIVAGLTFLLPTNNR